MIDLRPHCAVIDTQSGLIRITTIEYNCTVYLAHSGALWAQICVCCIAYGRCGVGYTEQIYLGPGLLKSALKLKCSLK